MTTTQELRQQLDEVLEHRQFRQIALDVSRYLHQKILENGEEAREIADVLHGKQLGHPLHPVLTDVTIGGWTFGFLFDIVAFITGFSAARKAANSLTVMSTLTAIPTAITGLADYSAIKKDAASYGAAHGLLNGVAFFCFARSSIARLRGSDGSAFFFSLLGMMVATVSAWIGGDLVYRHRVGVNHSAVADKGIEDWADVLAEAELEEGVPTRVEAGGHPILLFREGGNIHAIHAVCSHAGGPLDQGIVVKGNCVECPWHQSVFDLRDGQVVHGPSTFNQVQYMTRVRNGQIELRSWDDEMEVSSEPSLYDAPASEPEVQHTDERLFEPENLPSQAEGERNQ